MHRPTTSWIILTMGDRPEAVTAAVASIRAQRGPTPEIVVVGNGADPGPIDGAEVRTLPENLGVAGGRNVGAEQASGEVLFFLDDDATCAGPDVAETVLAVLDGRPEVAVVSMRITDPASGTTQRRHVPRLRAGDASRAGDVTTFLGGACAVRAADFTAAGGYPSEFHYAMEETDLAWRLLDRGRTVHYCAAAEVHHPATDPARHGHAFVLTARNRVWLAHRRLPLLLGLVYVAVWTVLMLVRAPTGAARRDVVRGLVAGLRETTPRPIEPMAWRTAWRMARLGRPPII